MLIKSQEAAANPDDLAYCAARELPRRDGAVDFERLYQIHGKRVYNLCWRMVWDRAEAEDLAQEVFMQLLRKIYTYRGEAAFTTWLHRLTVNVVLMQLRRKSRIEPALGEGTDPGDEPADSYTEVRAPSVPRNQAIERLDVENALARLPAGYRMVLVLHDVEGYEHGEIAGILGIREGTSKSQLHKARIRLRSLLTGDGDQHPRAGAGHAIRHAGRGAPMRKRASPALPWALAPQNGAPWGSAAGGDVRAPAGQAAGNAAAVETDELEPAVVA